MACAYPWIFSFMRLPILVVTCQYTAGTPQPNSKNVPFRHPTIAHCTYNFVRLSFHTFKVQGCVLCLRPSPYLPVELHFSITHVLAPRSAAWHCSSNQWYKWSLHELPFHLKLIVQVQQKSVQNCEKLVEKTAGFPLPPLEAFTH